MVGLSIFIWEHPYANLHGSSDFDSRAGFDLNTSHVFPQGVLSAIILLGGGVRDEGPEPIVSQGLPSAQWPSQSYLGALWVVPSCWTGSPEIWVKLTPFPYGMSSLSPALAPSTPRGSSAGAEAEVFVGNSQCDGCGGQAALQTPGLLLMCCLCKWQ